MVKLGESPKRADDGDNEDDDGGAVSKPGVCSRPGGVEESNS